MWMVLVKRGGGLLVWVSWNLFVRFHGELSEAAYSDCLMCFFKVKNNWIKESIETNQLRQC